VRSHARGTVTGAVAVAAMALAAVVTGRFPAAFCFFAFFFHVHFEFFAFDFFTFGFFRPNFCLFGFFAFDEAQDAGPRHRYRGGEARLRDRGGDQAGGDEEQGYALDSRAHPLENRPFGPTA
jgi:hypothetical protein